MNRKRLNPAQKHSERSAKKPKQINDSDHHITIDDKSSTSVRSTSGPVIRINADGKMEFSDDPAVIASMSTESRPPLSYNTSAVLKRDTGSTSKFEERLEPEVKARNPYLSTLGVRDQKRNHRIKPVLAFVEKGKFTAEAERARKLAEIELLKCQIERAKSRTILDSELVDEHSIARYTVPDVEWWDIPFKQTYSDDDINYEPITNLVHHPVHLDPVDSATITISQDVFLTAKERKRMRRLRRLDEQKEKQEQIRLGLQPQDEPKLKISNMMRVLGKEAVMDPTAMEKLVQKQVQDRLEKHLRTNEERKLTPGQRSEKNRLKYTEDTVTKTNVCVFAVKELSHPSHCFKITKNAEQLHLTGICISHEQCNIIIVEGGPKGVRKYQHLMMNRIDWNQDKAGEAGNCCVMVWEGLMNQSVYGTLRLQKCLTATVVQQLLTEQYRHFFELSKQALKTGTIKN